MNLYTALTEIAAPTADSSAIAVAIMALSLVIAYIASRAVGKKHK